MERTWEGQKVAVPNDMWELIAGGFRMEFRKLFVKRTFGL
jgi:hypothetical protein